MVRTPLDSVHDANLFNFTLFGAKSEGTIDREGSWRVRRILIFDWVKPPGADVIQIARSDRRESFQQIRFPFKSMLTRLDPSRLALRE